MNCLRGARSTSGHPSGPMSIQDSCFAFASAEGRVPFYITYVYYYIYNICLESLCFFTFGLFVICFGRRKACVDVVVNNSYGMFTEE